MLASTLTKSEEMRKFHQKILGRPLRETVDDHDFLLKSFKHRWIDLNDRVEELAGMVTHCERCPLKQLTFTVRYDEPTFNSNRKDLPRKATHLTEDVLKHLIAADETDWNPTWICPSRIARDVSKKRMLVGVKNCVLELKVEESKIPNAGKGLFIRCKRAPVSSNFKFRLEENERVDLGIYGPLDYGEFFQEHVSGGGWRYRGRNQHHDG